jgi:gliding motility-associated lipoprotein GldD
MAKSAQLEPVRNFAPDSCWFNIVYPEYKARVHCTYASGVQLDPVLKDAFSLAYEHEVKADAIEIERMDFEDGGMNLTWHIQGNAASPLQFLSTDGNDQFLRGALYFELRPNADSLNPVITRLSADVNHLVAHLDWR